MNAAELRQKKPEELRDLLAELRREQFNLRMQKGSGQLSRPSRVREVRREIARIKTVMAEAAKGGTAK
jgi:large subunit ribosomal protein L29